MDELYEIYQNINEKIQKTDINKLAAKSEEFEDITELLGTDPVKFIKALLNKEKLNTIISEYIRMSGVNKNDPDLQLLATSLATIITKVKKVDAKLVKDFPSKEK